MKKIYKFSKGFLPCAIISAVLIVFGIVGLFVKGINLGIDFKPGLIEEFKIAKDDLNVDAVRDALASIEGINVKELGTADERSFQVRTGISEKTEDRSLQAEIYNALAAAYGAENVEVIKEEQVGSQFSSSLAKKSIILVLATMLLIWLYATIRFHWDFALGSIIALVHDMLIMFTFITWTQMEFTTTVLAAVLTIIGYSINATVVILDRVRFNMKNKELKSFNNILDKSLSETLSRSIITTVTTMFASLSLFFFTTGTIKDFALALTIGLLSGMYSSMFISSGFISLVRRNWKQAD